MIVYTIVSPLVGWLGDRYNRRGLLAFGVGLWSVATVGTAFSRGFNDMFFWRALLGVGEASYGVIAPALLADLFAPKHRGRVMGVYYLALPLGGRWATCSAGGSATAGAGGRRSGSWGCRACWRAVGGLMIHDPGRGASEGYHHAGKADRPRLTRLPSTCSGRRPSSSTPPGWRRSRSPPGAYAAWGSTFYQTVRGMTSTKAGRWIGILTAAAGLLGIAVGDLAGRLPAPVHPPRLPADGRRGRGDRGPVL